MNAVKCTHRYSLSHFASKFAGSFIFNGDALQVTFTSICENVALCKNCALS